jgi:hypothetical protein
MLLQAARATGFPVIGDTGNAVHINFPDNKAVFTIVDDPNGTVLYRLVFDDGCIASLTTACFRELCTVV